MGLSTKIQDIGMPFLEGRREVDSSKEWKAVF